MTPFRAAALLSLAMIALIAALAGDRPAAIAAVTPGTITTFAGGGVGDGGPATAANVANPNGLAVDAAGSLYITDRSNCRIRKVTSGTITTVVGNGTCEHSGDGGAATSASLYSPIDVAVDGAGDLYISDRDYCVIGKVSAGIISTVVGSGTCGFSGDNAAASAATINLPAGIAVDGAGNLYIADQSNCRIRKVSGGIITTFAGDGSCAFAGDNGASTAASLWFPTDITPLGTDLYIADTTNCRIRKVSGGTITTVAGNGICGYGGDSGPAVNASLSYPNAVTLDGAGNLYIADTTNCRVRKATGGTITTFAGNGTCDVSGDGGAATSAGVDYPQSVAINSSGDLYIAHSDACRVRKVASGTITTFAGNGLCNIGGDGGPANNAKLSTPSRVALDGGGNLYIADQDNCRVRKVTPAGTISTIAGNDTCTYGGDGGSAIAASLYYPAGLAIDISGNVYIADSYNCRIRKVTAGTITTVAGKDTCDFSGDNASATDAALNQPSDVAVDPSGNLYIADAYNCRIRKVTAGTITTVAGNGNCNYGGDSGPATSAQLNYPRGVAVDGAGALYVADTNNCRIRKVTSGTIVTVAGDGVCGYGGDGLPPSQASLSSPAGIALDATANLYIADEGNCLVRAVIVGIMRTVAGNGLCAFGGDLGPATSASISNPSGVAVDGARTLYIADGSNNRVRKVVGQDSDGDGCRDARELGANTIQGGNRNPDNGFDFFDTPVPVIRPADATGTLSHAVTLSDAIAILYYIGTSAATPTQTNANGVMYGSDLNGNGVADGREYDRTIPDSGSPWRSGPPNDNVSIGDAIVVLAQVGADCR